MRERELRRHAICSVCGRHIGHAGALFFWTMTLERHFVKLSAMVRQDGLAALVGGPALAQVMGPDEEMAETVMGPVKLTACETCAMGEICLMSAAEEARGDGNNTT